MYENGQEHGVFVLSSRSQASNADYINVDTRYVTFAVDDILDTELDLIDDSEA